MKVSNRLTKQAIILLLVSLISQIYSLSNGAQVVVHDDVNITKVTTLANGNVAVLSNYKHKRNSFFTLLDSQGKTIYKDVVMNGLYFSSGATLTQNKGASGNTYFFAYHENKEREDMSVREYTMTFSEDGKNVVKEERRESSDQKTSVVSLKSGLIFIGSVYSSGSGGNNAGVTLNNPATNQNIFGETFSTPSKFISCVEQRENLVHCSYVAYQDVFISRLKVRTYVISNYTMNMVKETELKTFYTYFNFLKATVINETDTAILFQTGTKDDDPLKCNSGKDLFYLDVETTASEELVIRRYDHLYDNCIFREDAEYSNADIAVFSPSKTYVVCETSEKQFHGMIITRNTKTVIHFNFNNFDSNYVGYPSFAFFGFNLGLFYIINRDQAVYQIMNFPDCVDYRDSSILVPIYFYKEIELSGKVYLVNPYPASRVEEKMFFRLNKPSSLIFLNLETQEQLLDNTNYPASTIIKVIANDTSGIQVVSYTSSYLNEEDGLVTGKTCSITIKTPVCANQCRSCTKEEDTLHHYCLGCKVRHFSVEDKTAVDEGFGQPPVFCYKCDVACYSCYGNATNKTTNCQKCDYENGYYPFELDEKLCLNNETAYRLQIILKIGIFLYKPSVDIYTWIWKVCFSTCASCWSLGDSFNHLCTDCIVNYHFYYNMSFENNTLPGSCITGCEKDGYWIKPADNRCHPCLDNCLLCENSEKCLKCRPPYFLLPDGTGCVLVCPSCTAYDRELWECVYCKSRYGTPRYNLNQTCVYPMPLGYHLVENVCMNITICQSDGCLECKPWNSTRCISCKPEFYKEHFLEPYPETFNCYDYMTCGLYVGGAPINRSDEGLCLNCKLENGTYRYPNPTQHHEKGKPYNWVCIAERKRMTYIDIFEYNTLGWCYLRCASCDDYGIPDKMNCKTCRDSNTYKIYNFYQPARYTEEEIKQAIGDCIKDPPKCNSCPYYHLYGDDNEDLDNFDGEDICVCNKVGDVCTTCLSCPEDFPYYMIETRECVETCGFSDLLNGVCSMSNTLAALQFLRNPFYMKDSQISINSTQMIASIISTTIVQNYITKYGFTMDQFKGIINNMFGSGQYFNLPQSQIIIGNNVSIEFTTFKLELEKLAKIVAEGFSSLTKTETKSIVQMESCEQILKQEYEISEQEDLMIIKGDLIKNLSQYYASQMEYQVFSTSLGQFLDLCPCKSANSTVSLINEFNLDAFVGEPQKKISSIVNDGYDPFDSTGSFYTDVCTPYTNENGNDVLLDDRKADYFNAQMGICESGCTYRGYNSSIKMYTCECPVKDKVSNETVFNEAKFDPNLVTDDFYKQQKNSNIAVFKCASQVFSASGQKKNFGSYILLAGMASFVATFVLHILKGGEKMASLFRRLNVGDVKISNPPGKGDEEEGNKESKQDDPNNPGYNRFVKNQQATNIEANIKLYDVEINSLPYKYAKGIETFSNDCTKDDRTLFQMYWSYLKSKQIIIYAFFTHNDYQLQTTKIALFILFVAFYFAFTALFFNDNIMRELYKYKGSTIAALHIANVFLSSICSLIMGAIIRFVSLSERDISKLQQEPKETRNKAKGDLMKWLGIKTFILYGLSFIAIGICWYYVSAFCAIFKNSQGHYLLNVFLTFLVCNLWPCVLCFIPAFLRHQSLSSGNETLYKVSQIIAYL